MHSRIFILTKSADRDSAIRDTKNYIEENAGTLFDYGHVMEDEEYKEELQELGMQCAAPLSDVIDKLKKLKEEEAKDINTEFAELLPKTLNKVKDGNIAKAIEEEVFEFWKLARLINRVAGDDLQRDMPVYDIDSYSPFLPTDIDGYWAVAIDIHT